MKDVSTIGLDLAKTVFQVHGVDGSGKAVIRRQLRRGQVLPFFKRLPPCLVGIEACATSHYWAREITALGHEVRMMPARYVKPYVKRNKNDVADAEAICEAVTQAYHAIRADQDAGPAVDPDATPDPGAVRAPAHHAGQCVAGSFGGVRHRCRGGGATAWRSSWRWSPTTRTRACPLRHESCLLALRDQLALAKQQILEADRRILVWNRASELSRRLDDIPWCRSG